MKVARKQSASLDEWFEPGDVAVVLMLTVSGSAGSEYLLWSKNQQSIGMFSPSEFEIVDGSLPGIWMASLDHNGNVALAPQEWLNAGFWERYHEEDADAMNSFKKWQAFLENGRFEA
jgi:hypothetical protein